MVDITQLILCESPCTRSGQPPRAHGFQVESLPSYTRDWLSLYLLAELLLLLYQCRLDAPDVAVPILMGTSAMELSSLGMVASVSLKLFTSSTCTPFVKISPLSLLLTVTLLSSVLVSIPRAVRLFVTLSVRSCSSLLVSLAKSAVLSADEKWRFDGCEGFLAGC